MANRKYVASLLKYSPPSTACKIMLSVFPPDIRLYAAVNDRVVNRGGAVLSAMI